jgi:hypothetical protein
VDVDISEPSAQLFRIPYPSGSCIFAIHALPFVDTDHADIPLLSSFDVCS